MSKPLLRKNTRLLLTWLPIVLLVCSMVFYFLMKMQAHHMQKQQLVLKQNNVWNAFINKAGNLERNIQGEYDIKTNSSSEILNNPKDTTIYFKKSNQSLPFEMLTSKVEWGSQNYYITTYVSSTEIHHLIVKVFIIEAVILLLLLGCIVIINTKNSTLLWKPFFKSLDIIKDYNITNNSSLQLPPKTGIAEFDELNQVLNNLIHNVNTVYINQKEFVENASHEIQTPLSIIRSKLELLINQSTLTEKEALILADITEANNRLSQMNRTLLLLAKIENNQFPAIETVNFSKMIHDTVINLKLHYEEGFPELELYLTKDVLIYVNKPLIEIMLTNILKNAIIHNDTCGKLKIELLPSTLIIENTGSAPEVDTQELFERFRKGSHKSKTTGLGLAIVKQICQLYQYNVTYSYQDGWHQIKIILT